MFQYPDLGYLKAEFNLNTPAGRERAQPGRFAGGQGAHTGLSVSPASGLRYLRSISVRTAVHLLYLLPIAIPGKRRLYACLYATPGTRTHPSSTRIRDAVAAVRGTPDPNRGSVHGETRQHATCIVLAIIRFT